MAISIDHGGYQGRAAAAALGAGRNMSTREELQQLMQLLAQIRGQNAQRELTLKDQGIRRDQIAQDESQFLDRQKLGREQLAQQDQQYKDALNRDIYAANEARNRQTDIPKLGDMLARLGRNNNAGTKTHPRSAYYYS